MTTLNYAKKLLIELQKEQEAYTTSLQQYEEYKALTWWKKLWAKKVEKPHFSRFLSLSIVSRRHLVIDLRFYFSGLSREISLGINEDGRGFKVNLDTMTKESLIGSKGMQISSYAETVLDNYIKEFSPLIIE